MKRKSLLFIFTLIFLCLIFEFVSLKIYAGKFGESRKNTLNQNILIFGDSFALEFPIILKSKVFNYNVINDSESGAGPDIYFEKMRLLARLYKPKLIIVSFCVSNDILNLQDLSKNMLNERIKYYLGSNFYSYHLFRNAYIKIKYFKFAKTNTVSIDNKVYPANHFMKQEAKENPFLIIQNLGLEGEDINRSWRHMDSILKEMKRLADKTRATLILVAIPDCIQVNDIFRQVYKNAGFAIPDDFKDQGIFQSRLSYLASNNGIIFLDLLAEFKKIDTEPLYYFNDPHLNDYGTRYTADAIIKFLKNKELIF